MHSFLEKIRDHQILARIKQELFSFQFRGQQYRYFVHPYNTSWRNERIVEVPIVWREVEAAYRQGKSVLELGNVLSHYVPTEHTVVDKYEEAPGVINEDITTYQPANTFDLIVSISTLEHVGFDEESQDPAKIKQTVKHLKKLLTPGGRAVITFAVGYNPELDAQLRTSTLGFDEISYVQRTSIHNFWQERPSLSNQVSYDAPYPNSNVIGVGYLSK